MLRSLLICTFAFTIVSAALARPVTTANCLGKGLCAYVSPKDRVTCGPCPGQAKAIDIPATATAACMDDTWSEAKASRGACSGHGGVKVKLYQ